VTELGANIVEAQIQKLEARVRVAAAEAASAKLRPVIIGVAALSAAAVVLSTIAIVAAKRR